MSDSLLHALVLGRYRVVRAIAMGGMGVIYLGRSEGAAGFTKPVVIKRIVPDYATVDAEAEAFFIREAAILAQLRDPGIVGVIDFGHEADAYTMVLEYVHGFNLAQWESFHRRTGVPFDAVLAIHIVSVVLNALESAHTLKGPDGATTCVVHRDLTPSNVLIDVTGAVKLADFGIARVSGGAPEKTSSGMLRGKMPYLAPELLDGYAASVASDVYSAGVMLHALLVGTNEWNGATPAETLRLILGHAASSVEATRTDVPHGIDVVLAKALAKDPSARYRSASEFASALRALALPPSHELAKSLAERAAKDFREELPRVLGLEPLATLEAAWRDTPREASRDGASVERAAPAERSAIVERGTATPEERTVRKKRPGRSEEPNTETRPPERTLPDAGGRPASEPGTEPTEDRSVDAPLESPTEWAANPSHDVDAAASPGMSPGSLAAGGGAWLTGLLVASAIAVASVAVWLALRGDPVEAPASRYIVVEADPATDAVEAGPSFGSAPSPVVPENAEADAAHVRETPRADAGRPGSPTASPTTRIIPLDRRGLTRTFHGHDGVVQRCFADNLAPDAPAPRVEIHFHIDTAGRVESASVSPPGAASSPLGRCLVGVSRTMRFGNQPTPLDFAIPVTVARGSH